MYIIVADEWVYHYLGNERDELQSKKAFLFLKCVRARGDKLVVVRDSPFTTKVHRLAKENREPFKSYSKELTGIVSSDSCILLDQSELKPFPDECSIVKTDDRYLIRAQVTVPDSFILTSDGILIRDLAPFKDIKLKHVDAFLDGYIAECLKRK